MNKRREFTKAVKVEIIKRASRMTFNYPRPYCEQCESSADKFEIDHITPDGLSVDKSAPLTAKDGMLLCIPCHKEKTASDVASIAKAKRIEAKHIGADRPAGKLQSRGFPKSERASKIARVKIDKHAIPALPRKELGK